ncbi:caspase family protein [Mesorhizobium sp. ES1-1]|nr:caspase family protein [Mesorhizobium sp. ES1-1]
MAIFASLAFLCHGAVASNRIALVIGVVDYKYLAQLDRSQNDAIDMAELFRRSGYTKVFAEVRARDLQSMTAKVDEFISYVRQKAISDPQTDVVVYYSGHGVSAWGNNWLLAPQFGPVGKRRVPSQQAFQLNGLTLSSILKKLSLTKVRSTLLILDACRVQTVELGPSSRVGPSFSLVPAAETPVRLGALYAAAMSSVSYQKSSRETSPRNSVFTQYVLKAAQDKGIELNALVTYLQEKVEVATSDKTPVQSPAYYDSIPGQYYPFSTERASPGLLASPNVGRPVPIFYRDSRLADAQSLGVSFDAAKLNYTIAADDLSGLKSVLPVGSFRIAREERLDEKDEARFRNVYEITKRLAGDRLVQVLKVPSNKILNKPFQIVLF